MRVGDVLVEQRKLQRRDLLRALDDQPRLRQRVCSILIERGELEFDDAARALGEQRGVPCALARHLDGRDPDLAALLPPELARAACVLPIANATTGELIVCARDPTPELAERLAQLIHQPVVVVIAPATWLEELVVEAYGAAVEEIDVDMASGPLPAPTVPATGAPLQPPLPDPFDPESVRFALTDLDDERVAKDHTQSGQFPTLAPATGRGGTTGQHVPQPRTTLPPAAPTLAATCAALAAATTRDAATQLAMAFIAGRWVAGLVVAIRGESAIGYRGHGATLPPLPTIVLPLGEPSLVAFAAETRLTAIAVPAGAVQDQLSRALGAPTAPAATPVVVADDVVAVIAVGDSIHGVGDADTATQELGALADALGAAWQRSVGR